MRLLHRNELDFIGLDIRTINLSKRYFESGAIQLLHIEEVEDSYGVYHDVSAVLEVHGHLNECSFRINDYMEIEMNNVIVLGEVMVSVLILEL